MEVFSVEGELMDQIGEVLLAWVPVVVTALLSVFNVVILLKKANPEIRKLDSESDAQEANAAEASANAVKLYAEELTNVRNQIKELRMEMDKKDATIKERDSIILEQKTVISDLKDWAERLSYQLRSEGKEPVPFRATKFPRKV